jgi:hypothetical protein
VQQYLLEDAMAGSDLDKARALSAEDPSLFWLAVEVVAAGADVGAAAGAAAKLISRFGRLAPLAKEAKAAAGGAEAQKALDALKAEARAVGGEELALRVGKGVEQQGTVSKVAKEVEAVEAAGRVAEAELKAAGEAATKAGHVHVTPRGKLFSCSSPCTELRAKHAETLALDKNNGLLEQVGVLEKKVRDLGDKPAKADLDGIAKELGLLDDAIESASRLARAEKIAAWLPTVFERFESLKGLKLDAEAIARIIEKTHPSHIKGQLMEELMGARARQMLGTEAGKVALVGEKAAKEALEFIPGHRILDANGKQFTDGVIAIRRGEQFEVVAIMESKAGRASSRGMGSKWKSLEDAKGTTMAELRAEEESLRAKDLHPEADTVSGYMEARAEAIEDLRKANPKKYEGLSREQIENRHMADIDRVVAKQPKTEAGQIRHDIERLLSGPGAKIDGKPVVSAADPHTVPVVGAVPSDVNAEALKKTITEGSGVKKFDVMRFEDVASKDLETLAGEIAARAKSPTP